GGSLGVGKHRFHVPQVGRIDPRGSAKLALVLGGTLGEDVALARLVALHRAAAADPEALGGATLGLHLGHGCPPSTLVQQVAEPFRASDLKTPSSLLRVVQRRAQCFFFGARIMIIWRPSSFGHCSTCPWAARSASTRFSSAIPSSWCAISRPRNRNVTLVLSPSVRKRIRLRTLIL